MNKKLIIVCEKDSEKAANYLRDYIVENEKKKGDERTVYIETTVWSDKQYQDNQPTLSSKAAVVFLGKGKLVRTYTDHIETTEKYGMAYGYCGKTALLSVYKKISNAEYSECIEWAKEYELNLKDIKQSAISGMNVGTQVALGAFIPVVGVVEIVSGINGVSKKTAINTQRYKLLINIFYAEILPQIMED